MNEQGKHCRAWLLGDQPCGKGGCSLAVTWLVPHGSVPATTGWMPLDEHRPRVAWRVIHRISRTKRPSRSGAPVMGIPVELLLNASGLL